MFPLAEEGELPSLASCSLLSRSDSSASHWHTLFYVLAPALPRIDRQRFPPHLHSDLQQIFHRRSLRFSRRPPRSRRIAFAALAHHRRRSHRRHRKRRRQNRPRHRKRSPALSIRIYTKLRRLGGSRRHPGGHRNGLDGSPADEHSRHRPLPAAGRLPAAAVRPEENPDTSRWAALVISIWPSSSSLSACWRPIGSPIPPATPSRPTNPGSTFRPSTITSVSTA